MKDLKYENIKHSLTLGKEHACKEKKEWYTLSTVRNRLHAHWKKFKWMLAVSNHHCISLHLGSFKSDIDIKIYKVQAITSFATPMKNTRCQPKNVQGLNNFLKSCIKIHQELINLMVWEADWFMAPWMSTSHSPEPVNMLAWIAKGKWCCKWN